MITFDDSAHFAVGSTNSTLNSKTGLFFRWSEVVLAALRTSGLLDTMVDSTDAPDDHSILWLDKNTDPAVLKRYSENDALWIEVTYEWFRSSDSLTNVVASFDTVSDMKVGAALSIDGVVKTHGYASAGDGGGGMYQIVAAGTGTDDGGSYHDLTGITGQAKLLHNGEIAGEQFGAVDGVEASAQLQAAWDACVAWKDAQTDPDAALFTFTHGSTCTLQNQFAMRRSSDNSRVNECLVDMSKSHLTAVSGGDLTSTNAMIMARLRGVQHWGFLDGGKFAQALDFNAMSGSRSFSPKIRRFKGKGITVRGASGTFQLFTPNVQEYEQSDDEYLDRANFTSIGLSAEDGDFNVYGANILFCEACIELASNAVGVHFIESHPVNGNSRHAEAGQTGWTDPILIRNYATRANHFDACYFDNGIIEDHTGTVNIEGGHGVNNAAAILTGAQHKIYATEVGQTLIDNSHIANVGGTYTLEFLDTDDYDWAGDYASLSTDELANMADKNRSVSFGRTNYYIGTGNAAKTALYYKPQGTIQEEYQVGADNYYVRHDPANGQVLFEAPNMSVGGWRYTGSSGELTISDGSITPTGAYHTIDTEGDAATDDLVTIDTSNMPVGASLTLQIANADRSVNIVNLTGNIHGVSDIYMSKTNQALKLVRRGANLNVVDGFGQYGDAPSIRPYVALAFGQSGFSGSGAAIGGDRTANDSCLAWNLDHSGATVIQGTTFVPAEIGVAPYNNTGAGQPEPANYATFHAMKQVQETRGGETYIVQVADGGTSIESFMHADDLTDNGWSRGSDQNLYSFMVAALAAALPKIPGAPTTVDCIMINHGGANSSDSADLYAWKVQVVLDRLVTEGYATYAGTKLVVGELATSSGNAGGKGERQRAALALLANNTDTSNKFSVSAVSSQGLPLIDAGNLHLSGEGLVEQGRRYGRAVFSEEAPKVNFTGRNRYHPNNGLGWTTTSGTEFDPFLRGTRTLGDLPITVNNGHASMGVCYAGPANYSLFLHDREVKTIPSGGVNLSMEVFVDGSSTSAQFKVEVHQWDEDGAYISRNLIRTRTVTDAEGRVIVNGSCANPMSGIPADALFDSNARYYSAVYRGGSNGTDDAYHLNVLGEENISNFQRGTVFANRAAAIAAYIPRVVILIGILAATGDTLWYERNPAGTALTTADASTWAPDGNTYGDHFVENATAGTTDMSDAIIAAMAHSDEVYFMGTDYRVTKKMRGYARNGKSLIGSVKSASRILADTGSYDVFSFYTGEVAGPTPLAVRDVKINNLSFDTPGSVERTGGYYITFEERVIKFDLTDALLDNFYHGVKGYAMGYGNFTRCYWEGSRRTSTGGYGIDFTSDENAGVYNIDDFAGVAKVTDVHLTDCQFNPQNATLPNAFLRAVFIGAADGIYFQNCHLRGGSEAVEFATALSAGRTVISSVTFDSTYFDQSEGGHIKCSGYGNGHTFRPAGASVDATVKFRDILFDGCKFREAKGSNGSIYSAMVSGFVERVQVKGGASRDHQYSAIRSATAGKGFKFLIVSGVVFSGNNLANNSSHGDIYVYNNGHTITGNTHIGGSASAGYAIRVLADGASSMVSGNNLLNTSYPNLITFSSCAVFGNAGFVQVNEGTATLLSGDTEIVVTHGLDFTPNSADVSLTLGDATVSGVTRFGLKSGSITATQFTIETDAAPAANFRIYWKADAQRYL